MGAGINPEGKKRLEEMASKDGAYRGHNAEQGGSTGHSAEQDAGQRQASARRSAGAS